MHRQMHLKDVEIAKNLEIVRLNDQNIKQWIYFFLNDKSSNRPTKTLTFVKSLGKISFAVADYDICQ